MKTLRNIIIAVVAMVSIPATADDFEWLTVMFNDGTETDMSLSDFTSITFAEGNMTFNNGDNAVKTFDTKELKRMFFKADETAVDNVVYNLSDDVVIATTSGLVVGNSVSDLDKLPRGIYIVKSGQTVRKIVRK
ncbi:MAG: hypothetical protein J6M54_06235 [Prevotella sp.]|nr:hypothetical protein [Prevotella sp.]MBQ9177653.1 hypothetical protein [Prevotella sp.]MBR1525261.1 hypothetical protein [Prevotella sp.]MDY6408245.1 hypothetical protein [Prevotella sp.]